MSGVDDPCMNLLDCAISSRDPNSGVKPAKNPLKRLLTAVRRELHEVRTFNSLSLEEIQNINRQKVEAEKLRQKEHEGKMERKFGTVGVILANGAQSSVCCATAMSSAVPEGAARGGAVRL